VGLAGSKRAQSHVRWSTFVWVLAMTTMVLVNAGFLHWRAGWSIGPRYLVAGPPFFALGAAFALERAAGWSRGRRAAVRGLAAGLALASVVAIGLVGIVYTTLPETVSRPFMQFALPMSRTGFVPHHVLEWIGIDAAWPWYLAAVGLFGAPLLAALVPWADTWRSYVGRAAALACAAALGLVPALSKAPPEENGADLRWFATIWEPAGRDRITLARESAERFGTRRPCAWRKLGALERVLGMTAEAEHDEQRGGTEGERCPRAWF
jgi:hypothetical protein